MIRAIILGLLCLALNYPIISQTQRIDSLKNLLYESGTEREELKYYNLLAEDMLLISVDSGEWYLDKVASLLEQINDTKEVTFYNVTRGSLARFREDYEEAEKYYKEVIESKDDEGVPPYYVAKAYNKLGIMFRRQNRQDESISNNLKAIEIYESIDTDDSQIQLANCKVELGIHSKRLEQFAKALQYYNEAYDIYEIHDIKEGMSTCILNSANALLRLNRQSEALDLYKKSEAIALQLSNNEGLLAYIYGNLGGLYSSQNQPQQAYDYALKGYEIRKNKGRPFEEVSSLTNLAINLKNLNRPREALERLNQATQIAEANPGMTAAKEKIYKVLYETYKSTGNNSKAIEAIDQYQIYRDSLHREEMNKAVLEINEKYESEKKEKEIEKLKFEEEISELRFSRQRTILYIAGFSIFALGFLLYNMFNQKKEIQEKNTLISKSLSEKELLLREIHHRVKNNLQFISSLLSLQSNYVEDSTALGVLKQGQDRVRSMALIHQNLYQEDNLTGVDVKAYFEKLIIGLFQSNNIHDDRIELQLNISDIRIDVDTIIPIGLITNELITNSLKYAFPDDINGNITVNFEEKNDHLELVIADDGIGISPEQHQNIGKSFGYKMIHAFVNQLNGEIAINNDKGTSVKVIIRKYDLV